MWVDCPLQPCNVLIYIFCIYVCIHAKSYGFLPVYWQTQAGLHLSVHPQPASSSALLELRSHALCHYCPPQRLDLKEREERTKHIIFLERRRRGKRCLSNPLISSAHPVCFESSVSRGGGSCPAHPHPTQ